MFCYQCQETAGCTGCTRAGVCGKSARTAALQDLLIYVTRGLCQLTTALRNQGEAIIPEDDRLVTENLFVTITNANFDQEAILQRIRDTLELGEEVPVIPFSAEKGTGREELLGAILSGIGAQ